MTGTDDERVRAERARAVGLFRYSLVRQAADPELTTRARGRLVRELARISTQAVRGNPFGGRETALTCDDADRQTRRRQQIVLRSACQITSL